VFDNIVCRGGLKEAKAINVNKLIKDVCGVFVVIIHPKPRFGRDLRYRFCVSSQISNDYRILKSAKSASLCHNLYS